MENSGLEKLFLTIAFLDKVNDPVKDIYQSFQMMRQREEDFSALAADRGGLQKISGDSPAGSINSGKMTSLDLFLNRLDQIGSAFKTGSHVSNMTTAVNNKESTDSKIGKPLNFPDLSAKLQPTLLLLEKINSVVPSAQIEFDNQVKPIQIFGDDGADTVSFLIKKAEILKSSIGELNQVRNSSPTVKMANSMTESYGRFSSSMKMLEINFAQNLLPALDAVVNKFSFVRGAVDWCVNYIPGLRFCVTFLADAFSAVSSALDTFRIYLNLSKELSAFWGELRNIYAWCLRNSSATYSMTIAQRINAIVQMLWQKSIGQTVLGQKLAVLWTTISTSAIQFWTFSVSKATAAEKLRVMWSWICTKAEISKNIAINAGIGAMLISSMLLAKLAIGQKLAAASAWIMSGGFLASASAAWAFTVALLANPITWIVLGIAALTGGLAALIYYWDDACNFCVKYADYILLMLGPIGWVIAAFRNWDKIMEFLSNLWAMFKKVCPNIANLIEKLVAIVWAGIKAPFLWIQEKLQQLGSLFLWFGSLISAPFQICYEWIADRLVPAIQFFSNLLEEIQRFFGTLFSGISGFGSAIADSVMGIFTGLDGWIGSILKKVSKIPGFGFLNPDISVPDNGNVLNSDLKTGLAVSGNFRNPVPKVIQSAVSPKTSAISFNIPSRDAENGQRPDRMAFPEVVAARRETDISAGGIRNTKTTTKNYGGINIVAPNGISPAQLDEWLLLQGN